MKRRLRNFPPHSTVNFLKNLTHTINFSWRCSDISYEWYFTRTRQVVGTLRYGFVPCHYVLVRFPPARNPEYSRRFPRFAGDKKGASLMKISGTLTTKPMELQRAYQPPQTNTAQTQKTFSFARRFDSVTISEENSPILEARSRLSNEVRTATSSASVAALREEIRQGTYPLDSRAIAQNMLLWGG